MGEALRVTLDQQGCITLPRAARQRLGLSPGMTLIVEEGDRERLRLRVQRNSPRLVLKGGVLVARGEVPGDLANVVDCHREERIAEVARRGIS